MKNDDFFIGWMPKAPKTFARQIKKVIFILIPIVVVTGILLSVSQKPFSTGNFEFGKLTEVKGIFFREPVPLLKAINGKDIFGNPSFITIPLIGFGKSGAGGTIASPFKTKSNARGRRSKSVSPLGANAKRSVLRR